jgi:hypothetical protein
MPVMYPDSKAVAASPELGVLVCEREDADSPFAESAFVKRISLLGAKAGLTLFAFDPWTWNEQTGCVKGYHWNGNEGRWEQELRKLPEVVYDRSWPADAEERRRFYGALRTIAATKRLYFLNGRLPDKAKVHERLAGDARFAGLLPPTAIYAGRNSLVSWLNRHRHAAFLKPACGTQGKRVVAIQTETDGTVTLAGRTSGNRPFRIALPNVAAAIARIDRWIGSRLYLMQPLLPLRSPSGQPFDLRSLVQKNDKGLWTVTGIAVRRGQPDTVTANLHGGGEAFSAREWLAELFGERKATELQNEIALRSMEIVSRLEEQFGRFAEIGLDFAVEPSGTLWFLEANAKPGRTAMQAVGPDTADLADAQPLSYARSILLRTPGRVIHEFDHL